MSLVESVITMQVIVKIYIFFVNVLTCTLEVIKK